MSDRTTAYNELEKLRSNGVTDTQILEYIIGNHLSGATALDAVLGAKDDLCPDDEDLDAEDDE